MRYVLTIELNSFVFISVFLMPHRPDLHLPMYNYFENSNVIIHWRSENLKIVLTKIKWNLLIKETSLKLYATKT